ncbi:MAG TPA: YIP1 family protein [Spirochaetota bacterium]|nr:YIP1 family protein [Candidatus Omnitrophota bacterium]MDD5736810.1 YIP1 family protein [Candidatus Omnitrophota bacterium]HOX10021.1 YIP1 family protein [Candidatus Omnitrophota bacterium]HPO44696.1 YIP1 family protein [Spirochaetota bacterium]HRZ67023.1 YIP1 family protein [Candidatus Omnitrophota bacterium]
MAESSNIFLWIIKTCGKVILKPSEFFDGLSGRKPEYRQAYAFSFLLTFVSVIAAVATDTFLAPSGVFATAIPEGLSLATIIGAMVASAVVVFFIAALLHGCLIVAGSSGSIKKTFLVTAYSSAAYIFFVVPFIGGTLSNIVWIILVITGLKKIHDISIVRAIAGVLAFMIIPVIIGMLFVK